MPCQETTVARLSAHARGRNQGDYGARDIGNYVRQPEAGRSARVDRFRTRARRNPYSKSGGDVSDHELPPDFPVLVPGASVSSIFHSASASLVLKSDPGDEPVQALPHDAVRAGPQCREAHRCHITEFGLDRVRCQGEPLSLSTSRSQSCEPGLTCRQGVCGGGTESSLVHKYHTR